MQQQSISLRGCTINEWPLDSELWARGDRTIRADASGRMHIGNVYAMLGAWLSARAGGPERTSRTGGGAGDADCLNNVNRVDGMSGAAIQAMRTAGEGACCCASRDIDTPRVLPDADRWIMDDLAWLGLDWDGEPV